eukprot:g12254.t1
MRDSIESLDHALLDSAARFSGCGICVALLMGRRLVVGTLGACRAVLSQKSRSGTWTGRPLAPEQVAHQSSLRRWHHAYAPLNAVDLQSGALRPGCSLHAASATAEQLAQFPEEERLLQRVERAAHPFAALGLTVQQLQGGVAQRARAECEEQLQVLKERFPERVTAALARVQEASEEIESFLRMDTYVTQILAELYYLVDEEGGIPAPKRAAAHLGVEPGCGEAAAQAGIDRRFRALMTQLAQVSPSHAQRGFRILAELADTVQRPQAAVWVPTAAERSVGVARALGFRDLKRPRPLVGLELSSEVMHLEDSSSGWPSFPPAPERWSSRFGFAPPGAYRRGPWHAAQSGSASTLGRAGREASEETPRRGRNKNEPGVSADAAAQHSVAEAVGVIAVSLQVGVETEAKASDTKGPEAKKRKVENVTPGGKRKVRVSEADSLARRKASRTQAAAERLLMQTLEELQRPKPGEHKET